MIKTIQTTNQPHRHFLLRSLKFQFKACTTPTNKTITYSILGTQNITEGRAGFFLILFFINKLKKPFFKNIKTGVILISYSFYFNLSYSLLLLSCLDQIYLMSVDMRRGFLSIFLSIVCMGRGRSKRTKPNISHSISLSTLR